jgi:hypothetical protein
MGSKQINSKHLSKLKVNVIIECYDLLRNRFPFSKSGGKSIFQNVVNLLIKVATKQSMATI